MKLILATTVILASLLAVGCYPVGHRYHDEDTHNAIMGDINDTDGVGHW